MGMGRAYAENRSQLRTLMNPAFELGIHGARAVGNGPGQSWEVPLAAEAEDIQITVDSAL